MRMIEKKSIYKSIWIVLVLLVFSCVFNLTAAALASAEIAVTVCGDGVTNPATFTLSELEAMPQLETCFYSTINTWPTKKIYMAQGVRLADILEEAGILPEAQVISFTSTDGFKKTITRKQLEEPRYYYPGLKENHEYYGYIPGSPEGAIEIDSILALKSVEGSDNPELMHSLDAPLLLMGQRWITEQTNEMFLKNVAMIEVSTAAPEKWENPAATPSAGSVSAGTLVELSTSDMDGDTIHYTTDGSEPGFENPIYNWVKKRWWGSRMDELADIIKPIEIYQDTSIKAIAIGPGKQDSDIVTFNYHVLLNPAPELRADSTDNKVGQAIEISFTDDESWRAAITGLSVDNISLEEAEYTVGEGSITIKEGVLNQAQDYIIKVQADGYLETSVIQSIESDLENPPELRADSTDNKVGQAIEISFTDDESWRVAITGLSVGNISLEEAEYTVGEGKITIKEGVMNQAQDYVIKVQASGYLEASVIQKISSSLRIDTPSNGQSFNRGQQILISGSMEGALCTISVEVSDPGGKSVYGPEDINISEGSFQTEFTLDPSSEAGEYTIILSATELIETVIGTFTVKPASNDDVEPDEEVVLTITGSGVEKATEFTLSALQDMEQYQHIYSAINTWPSKKLYVGKGVILQDLLDSAGMKDNARLIRFTAVDGYSLTLTLEELLNDRRYYFPRFQDNDEDSDGHIPGSSSGAQRVEAILALESAQGTDNPDYMNDLDALLLMMGQRAVSEQTAQLFVKNVNEIEVLDSKPSRWDSPEAAPESGEVAVDTLVRLSNRHMDDDKIYYTTDGSTPTLDSPMYNWIAKRWWSSREDDLDTINHPIEIKKDTIIKAITIGPGKEDSKVATFSYQIKETENLETDDMKKISPSEGGVISCGSEASVVIPANALRENDEVEVSLKTVDSGPAAPAGYKLASNVYELSVEDSNTYCFASKVTVKLNYDADSLEANEPPAIYCYDEGMEQWVKIEGALSGNIVSAELDCCSRFALMTVQKGDQNMTFTDISGHWALDSIDQMVAWNCINGYPDGSFKPNNTVSRAEFATMLVKAFELEKESGKIFADTAEHWAKDYIATTAGNGVVNGYDTETFGPNDLITREQMAVMISRAAKLALTEEELQFADSSKISVWARGAIVAVSRNGIMQGYPDNTIRPQGSASRAEAVTVIVNALNNF